MPGLMDLLKSVSERREPDVRVKPSSLSQLAQPEVNEDIIINQVADEYNLQGDARKLLGSIRKVEQGRQGREFGVLEPEAMRFENGDPVQSFITQARWAAGTIKKRFTGDLESFANRWAPTVGATNDPTGLNKNWLKNIKSFMNKEK